MQKIIICKNIFATLCIEQIILFPGSEDGHKKFLSCSTHRFAFWLTVVTDRALQMFGYFLKFYCSTIIGNISVSRIASGHQFAMLM